MANIATCADRTAGRRNIAARGRTRGGSCEAFVVDAERAADPDPFDGRSAPEPLAPASLLGCGQSEPARIFAEKLPAPLALVVRFRHGALDERDELRVVEARL